MGVCVHVCVFMCVLCVCCVRVCVCVVCVSHFLSVNVSFCIYLSGFDCLHTSLISFCLGVNESAIFVLIENTSCTNANCFYSSTRYPYNSHLIQFRGNKVRMDGANKRGRQMLKDIFF